jgi:periplasmic protein TonB
MFEDSTFESTGRIKTRSRRWMFATLALNASALIALILIPLIHPEALPHSNSPILMEPPKPPVEEPKPLPKPERVVMVKAGSIGSATAPVLIPRTIFTPGKPEALDPINTADIGGPGGGSGVDPSAFRGQTVDPVVKPASPKSVRISATEMPSPIYRTTPAYPAIARAARVQGTVILQATISRNGTIENLRVVSGPAMLQQAAVDAVRQWRYKPFLLNGDPVEVETTVNVVFTLGN